MTDAEFVRTARRQLGLTQPQLAAELGVSKRTVVRWETQEQPMKRRDRIAITLLVDRPRASKKIA